MIENIKVFDIGKQADYPSIIMFLFDEDKRKVIEEGKQEGFFLSHFCSSSDEFNWNWVDENSAKVDGEETDKAKASARQV